MTDYTPTTEVIRHALSFPRERLGEPRPIKPEAFDRWLEQVRADAIADALPTREEIAEAISDGWNSVTTLNTTAQSIGPSAAADAVLALLKGQEV